MGVTTQLPDLDRSTLDSRECWETVERMARSGVFKRAARSREFLLFVAERRLKAGCDEVHEQEIGSAVFGRVRDYDTSQDNIVRVNATELRKRIDSYYAGEGACEPILVEIPRGGYMPVFRRRALEERTPQTPVPGLTPTRTAFTETPAPETVTRSRLALLAAMLCIATLAAACALLWGQNRTLRRSAGVTNATPAVRAFWQPFLSHRERTDVVLPDTSISLIQDITNRQIPLSEYLSRKYPDETEAPGLSGDRRMDLETIGRRHLSGFGDFQVAQRMLSLPFNNGSMFLQFAREYTPESVKYNNVILIGGRRSNPWVELFATRMNFSIEYDARLKKTAIRNRFPRKGEQTLYGLSPDPFQSDGYCVVAFLPNPSHSADAVIFAGTNAEATNAAGEFLSTEKPLAGFRKLLSADKFPYFEVLLRTTRLSGTALSAELLTYRSYPE